MAPLGRAFALLISFSLLLISFRILYDMWEPLSAVLLPLGVLTFVIGCLLVDDPCLFAVLFATFCPVVFYSMAMALAWIDVWSHTAKLGGFFHLYRDLP